MKPSRKLTFAIVLASLVVALTGCSYSYEYDLEGTIKSAETGELLTDVSFSLTINGDVRQFDGVPVFLQDHHFSAAIRIRDGDFGPEQLPKVILTISKRGYLDEQINISPPKDPSTNDSPPRIIIVAYLRRL